MLGQFRQHMHPDIGQRLIDEIDKDYCGRTALDVAGLLDKHEA